MLSPKWTLKRLMCTGHAVTQKAWPACPATWKVGAKNSWNNNCPFPWWIFTFYLHSFCDRTTFTSGFFILLTRPSFILPPNKKVRIFSLVLYLFSTHVPRSAPQKKDIQSPSHRLVGYVDYILQQQPTRGKPNKKYHPTGYWIGWLGWVGCQQPGGKQVFGTFDHVALPLDFCFPGFVSTEARKLNQGRSVGFMLFFFGIMFCCFWLRGSSREYWKLYTYMSRLNLSFVTYIYAYSPSRCAKMS